MNYVTPSGFRDVLFEEASARESITRAVQQLFADRGYVPVETPTLEVMDVMRAGGRGCPSPFKFFDSRGDLLAMRPDVTLQIARMCATRLDEISSSLRLRYTQRVFREADADPGAVAREMTQIGIECIGEGGADVDAEIVSLLGEALLTSGVRDFSLSIATVGVLRSLLDKSGASSAWKSAVFEAYHASDFVELDRLTDLDNSCTDVDTSGLDSSFAQAVRDLPRIRGGREAIEEARSLVAPLGCVDGLEDFERTYDELVKLGLEDRLLVDFSVMSSFDYYTGIVFEAYSPYLGTPLGSGGRYDHMIGAYGAERPAAGFAFCLEQAMSASAAEQKAVPETASSAGTVPQEAGGAGSRPTRPLRIAIPKGSLNADTVSALGAAGFDVAGLADPGRQLIISSPEVEFVIVRPSDAPTFVALGAADCGICGKDSLLEADAGVVELVDLKFGECRFIVAEPEDADEAVKDHYQKLGSIRVATKYPHITAQYYAKTGVQVEIVRLHGNIELAPLTGMAERIVDITATGTTLRENNLRIVDEVFSSTARFFANTCAFRTDERIVELATALQHTADVNDYEPIAGKS